jgi:hypothetical protein
MARAASCRARSPRPSAAPPPPNGSDEEIVHAAGFYTAVERPLHSPPMEGPIPDKKALFREDTGDYLSTVSTGYEVVQFEEVARLLRKKKKAPGSREPGALKSGGGGNRTRAGRCETPSRIAPLPRNRPECLGVDIPPRPLLSRPVPAHSARSCDIRATWRKTQPRSGCSPGIRIGPLPSMP